MNLAQVAKRLDVRLVVAFNPSAGRGSRWEAHFEGTGLAGEGGTLSAALRRLARECRGWSFWNRTGTRSVRVPRDLVATL